MIIKCKRCGAPLNVVQGSPFVECEFCGATTMLEQPKPPPRPVYHPPPASTGAQPPPYRPIPGPRTVQSSGGSKMGFVIAGLSVLIALGGAAVPALMSLSSAGVNVKGLINNATGPKYWNATDAACLVDANGDGILDVTGMSGTPSNRYDPTIIDGATGKVIWKNKATGSKGRFACLNRKWFAIWQPDFKVFFYEAASPHRTILFNGTDKLRAFGSAPGCARLKTADGEVRVITLPGGGAGKCSSVPLRKVYDNLPGHIGLTGEATTLQVGRTTIRMNKRRRGTEMLELQVSELGGRGWSKKLAYASPTFGTAVTLGQGVLGIWAARPGKLRKALLVGLDQHTGAELYAVPMPGLVTNNIRSLQFNGRYFIAAYWTGLHAIDPKTGKNAWVIGK